MPTNSGTISDVSDMRRSTMPADVSLAATRTRPRPGRACSVPVARSSVGTAVLSAMPTGAGALPRVP